MFERHARPGQETTSRNSGVIHSGIYYPAGASRPHCACRVASCCTVFVKRAELRISAAARSDRRPEASAALHAFTSARGNGVLDLELLDRDQVARLEPAVFCAAGLLSPSTGIIDVHELLLALLADLEAHGSAVLLQSVVSAAKVTREGIVLSRWRAMGRPARCSVAGS